MSKIEIIEIGKPKSKPKSKKLGKYLSYMLIIEFIGLGIYFVGLDSRFILFGSIALNFGLYILLWWYKLKYHEIQYRYR